MLHLLLTFLLISPFRSLVVRVISHPRGPLPPSCFLPRRHRTFHPRTALAGFFPTAGTPFRRRRVVPAVLHAANSRRAYGAGRGRRGNWGRPGGGCFRAMRLGIHGGLVAASSSVFVAPAAAAAGAAARFLYWQRLARLPRAPVHFTSDTGGLLLLRRRFFSLLPACFRFFAGNLPRTRLRLAPERAVYIAYGALFIGTIPAVIGGAIAAAVAARTYPVSPFLLPPNIATSPAIGPASSPSATLASSATVAAAAPFMPPTAVETRTVAPPTSPSSAAQEWAVPSPGPTSCARRTRP